MQAKTSEPKTLTPSQLNREARSLLESHFDFVWVEGELSNFARPSSGHWYFSLKDSSAQVRCAMFRNRNQRLRFQPKDGEQVRLRARVSLYEGRGEFQLIGEFMEPAGAGALQARFEALRDQLAAEGLFDAQLKQPLPTAVSHLAVITSASGAALQDILQVLKRRNPAILVSVLPVPVQGDTAAPQIRAAIERANHLRRSRDDCDFDAILLARGGGSLEDLWAFNDEALARTIAASELPLVCGVGHEVDVTIADFAADMRAPTPSAAAELLSDDSSELMERIGNTRRRLESAIERQLERATLRLGTLAARLRDPGHRLREQSQRLDELELRLHRGMGLQLHFTQTRVARLRERLLTLSPARRTEQAKDQLERLRDRLGTLIQQRLQGQQERLHRQEDLLRGLNPLAILSRGYAVVSTEDGQVLRDSRQLSANQRIYTRLGTGSFAAQVTEIDTEPKAGENGATR